MTLRKAPMGGIGKTEMNVVLYALLVTSPTKLKSLLCQDSNSKSPWNVVGAMRTEPPLIVTRFMGRQPHSGLLLPQNAQTAIQPISISLQMTRFLQSPLEILLKPVEDVTLE